MQAKDDAPVLVQAKNNKEELIKQLIEEHRKNTTTSSDDHDDEHRLLLCRFLSQLESLKEASEQQSEHSTEAKELRSFSSIEPDSKIGTKVHNSAEVGADEILRERKKVKRQNTITHWLLSFMIVITTVWQLSEVSIILAVKDKCSHPFRAIGNMITGALKGGPSLPDLSKSPSLPNPPQGDALPLPSLLIPELPQVDISSFVMNDDQE